MDKTAWDAAGAWADDTASSLHEIDGHQGFTVWPENWDTLLLFLRLQRLWRIAPFGGRIGFDWAQIQAMMALEGRRELGADLRRLEAMEDAALEELTRRE